MKKASFETWCIENRRFDLLYEWLFEKNYPDCTPDSVSFGSDKKVWWKCKDCGNVWETRIYIRTSGHGCPKCAREQVGQKIAIGRTHKGVNDVASVAPHLLKEWAFDKNTLSPFETAYNSNKKVWWKCKRCGNEWLASINNRFKGSRCPRCMSHFHTSYSEQTVFYYVKKAFPDAIGNYSPFWLPSNMEIDIFVPSLKLGIEYDGEAYHGKKRDEKDASKASYILDRQICFVRIREPKLDSVNDGSYVIITEKPKSNLLYLERPIRELFSFIEDRYNIKIDTEIDIKKDYDLIIQSVRGIIMSKSFGALFPEKALMWNNEKNGTISPFDFTPGSGVKVWWACQKCGFEWRATIGSVANGSGCPVCAGKLPQKGTNDLATLHPELLPEWSPRNELEPSTYLSQSSKKVWWKCSSCGHEWQAQINNRTSRGSGCPVCSLKRQRETRRENIIKEKGSFATNHSELLKEWFFEKNTEICDPEKILSSSHIKVWWKCHRCGHEWMAFVYSRSGGRGCPSCKARKMRAGG